MNEYINKIINIIKDVQFKQQCKNFAKDDDPVWERYDTYNDVINLIKKEASVDVALVKYGENVGKDYDPVDQFVCSECGIELQDWRKIERDEEYDDITCHEYVFRYCPNCGAKMKIEE